MYCWNQTETEFCPCKKMIDTLKLVHAVSQNCGSTQVHIPNLGAAPGILMSGSSWQLQWALSEAALFQLEARPWLGWRNEKFRKESKRIKAFRLNSSAVWSFGLQFLSSIPNRFRYSCISFLADHMNHWKIIAEVRDASSVEHFCPPQFESMKPKQRNRKMETEWDWMKFKIKEIHWISS